MPANNQYPVLNGITPSWADIQVTVEGSDQPLIERFDIAAINSSATVEVGEQRAGGRVIKRTTGSVSCEAAMTLYRPGYMKLLRGLIAAMPTRGAQRLARFAHFNITYQFTPEGDTEIYERRIKGCFISGSSESAAEGTDASQIEVSLNPLEVVDVIDGEEVIAL